ncbi:hypothetical protein AMK27_37485 [Streptomyces sp. CB02009]|nr:hypothetical protein AMK27_37485 [Streptomyces sp. CB02009]
MAQEVGEDSLGEGDAADDGVGDDGVSAEKPGTQVFARRDGQPDEPLGGAQRTDPAACGGAASARE